MFDVKRTKIYQAVKLEKIPFFRFLGLFKQLFLLFFVVALLFSSYGFLTNDFSWQTSKILLGASVLSLVFFLLALLVQLFFESEIKNPKLESSIKDALQNPSKYNLAEFLGFDVAKAVYRALRYCRSEKATSTHILCFLLNENKETKFIFSRLLLSLKDIKNGAIAEIESLPRRHGLLKLSKSFKDAVISALKRADKKGHLRVDVGDMFTALAKIDPFFKKVLVKNDLKEEDIENLADWLDDIKEKIKKNKRFWDYDNLLKKGTLAREWTAGYTVTLDKYSKDITSSLKAKDFQFVGHKKELQILEEVLSRSGINNALLVGEPGTGKKSIIYALAHKSLLGKSSSEVNYKRIVELDMSLLLSEIENIETAESVLNKIFEEVARAGNVILVIDEFYNYVGQQTGIGMLDISGVLNSYLRLPQFKLIAITTYQGFHRYIEKNPSMASLFEKIEVEGISMRDTLILLEYLTFFYEKKYKIFVSYPALRRIIEFSDRYFPSFPFPEKAINILDAVAAFVANSIAGRVVLPKHIAKIVSEKTEIPVGEVEKKEKDILLNLENLIHQRVINQEEAVRDVAVALRRARSEIATKKGPMGSFLFLGPTGVGKTETAKALAEVYFGSEEKMIRLDMSEFQNVEDIKHLIGSSSENGILTDKVRDNPFSLVLLDEIEKAHPNILNLFLQVLDEGHLTDGVGRKVDFRNTIIIATGNAGYKTILESLNQGGREEAVDWKETKQKLLNELFEKRIFRPEFINRFDAFVVFKPLSRENLLDISELIMRKLKKNLGEKGIDFVITEKLKEKIVKLSYNPVFGAREMKRVVQDKVESVLASALLSGRIKRGQRVELNPDDFSLKISPEI